MLLVDGCATRSFRGATGGAEHYITVEALPGYGLAEQIHQVERRYAEAVDSLGLAPDTAVFRRIYLSDVPNQIDLVSQSTLFSDPEAGPVAVAVVQQPPLVGAKVALLAYHIETPEPLAKLAVSPNHTLIEKNGLGHLWSTQLCAGTILPPVSAGDQTRAVFEDLIKALAEHGGTLRENCVRTWLYVRDVDVFYQDLVDARTAVYDQQGLTADTHYIASTGIEGACPHRYDTVLMDAYSILGLDPAQMSYLNDFSRLCPTKEYEVTFERGTRIAYADRAHHFISGTASIDRFGRVVHVGQVLRQLDRTLENVDALLRSGGARLDDMSHLLVYLRDPADFARVDAYIAERFPRLPVLLLRGAVCRPEWLIEVEGIAVVANDAPDLPAF
jgi:enamine deaminase RidA (YjgF/YER057c/UK114 family)